MYLHVQVILRRIVTPAKRSNSGLTYEVLQTTEGVYKNEYGSGRRSVAFTE